MRRTSATPAAGAIRAVIRIPQCCGFRDHPMMKPDCGTVADISIDVSCMHHCFGSRESLFAQAFASDTVVG